MYTHTHKNKRPLDFPQYPCVYLTTAWRSVSHPSAWPRLGTETFQTLKRENYERLHFFHRQPTKVAAGVRSQNTNESVRQHMTELSVRNGFIYPLEIIPTEKVRLSTGQLAHTSTPRHGGELSARCVNKKRQEKPYSPSFLWMQHLWLLVRGTLFSFSWYLRACVKLTERTRFRQAGRETV